MPQKIAEFKNLYVSYGEGDALKGVSLEIDRLEHTAILGANGSGKSTLMHAMSGLDRPQRGEVIVDGRDILQLKAKQIDHFRASKIGFIFQSFFVEGNESVADNVSLPLEIAGVPRRQRAAKIAAALDAVELSEKRTNRAKDLSGGQKQRLAIARAIVNNPQIIFADEPTGNLDSETGALVERLLFGYNRDNGTTLIVVTHDEELAEKCDYQIVIKDGKIERSTVPTEMDHGS